jgi:hypothetical protein
MPTMSEMLTGNMRSNREPTKHPTSFYNYPSAQGVFSPIGGGFRDGWGYNIIGVPAAVGVTPPSNEVLLSAWINTHGPGGPCTLFAGLKENPVTPNQFRHCMSVGWNPDEQRIEIWADDTGPFAGSPNLTRLAYTNVYTNNCSLLRYGQWIHIGLYAIRQAAFEAHLYVDGQSYLQYISGGGTEWLEAPDLWQCLGTGVVSTVGWIGNAYFKDFVIYDVTGEGDQNPESVRSLFTHVDGAGSSTAWTPKSAANWTEVDDPNIVPDGDTTYVQTATVGNKDLYTHEGLVALTDLPYSYTIQGNVLVQTEFKNVDDGEIADQDFEHVVRVGAVEATNGVFSSTHGLDTWDMARSIFTQQPDTSAWNLTDYNNAEFGYESV